MYDTSKIILLLDKANLPISLLPGIINKAKKDIKSIPFINEWNREQKQDIFDYYCRMSIDITSYIGSKNKRDMNRIKQYRKGN